MLGGPVIGFNYVKNPGPLAIIVGDQCRPKSFGAKKLPLLLGEERELVFYWQDSYADYSNTCLTKGLFYVQNYGELNWVHILANKVSASVNPIPQNIYSSNAYLSITYKHEVKATKLSILKLYN